MSATGRPENGFTLLELMVALAVAGLLLTLVPPLLDGRAKRVNVNAETRLAIGLLRLAHTQALALDRQVAFVLDTTGRAFWVEDALEAPRGSLDPSWRAELTTDAGGVDERGGWGRVVFYPDGTSSGARLTIAAAGRRSVITIDWLTSTVTDSVFMAAD